jgi:hypothetical protein
MVDLLKELNKTFDQESPPSEWYQTPEDTNKIIGAKRDRAVGENDYGNGLLPNGLARKIKKDKKK